MPKITDALQTVPELLDVNSDQQDKGLEVDLKIDRATASRLGLTASQVDNTLYDAFGQRQVSTIYKDKNQYHVVMEVAPAFWQSPETLRDIFVSTSGGAVSGTQSTAGAGGALSSQRASRRPGARGQPPAASCQRAERLPSPRRGAQPAAQSPWPRARRRLLHRRFDFNPG